MPEKNVFAVPSFGVVVQIAFWALLFGFIISLSSLVLRWPDVLYRAVLTLCCHLINFYFFYSFLMPRYFEKGKYISSLAGCLLLLTLITPLRMHLESLFVIDISAFSLRIGANARAGFIIFSEVTIAAFASLLKLAVSSDKMKNRLKDMEKNQLETELRFLKAQMSPHFLFNSINNIYSLVLLKSDQAPNALMKLSILLRYLLYECDHKVSIAKEVEALKTFNDLFQLKFETPLKLNWDIRLMNSNRHIEPLFLVPLLENAMKHSGLGTDPDAEVHIAIISNEKTLKVKTGNSISTVAPLPDERGGIGLANIKKRLERIFPGAYRLEINQSANWFSLTLEMPLL